MEDAVSVVLSEVTTEGRSSDKGKIGSALRADTGISALLKPGTYEAVMELTTPRAARLHRELRNLHTTGVQLDQAAARLVAEWGHRGERRYRDASQVSKPRRSWKPSWTWAGLNEGSRSPAPTAVSAPSSRWPKVPTRGPATCSGCRSHQRYTLATTTPKIVYRLDALVDRASEQGVLPHLLVIAALHHQDPKSSLLPGADVVFPDGQRAEVDVFGVHQARVLAGEVKTKAADSTPCLDAGLDLLVLDATQLRPGNHEATAT